MTAVVFLLFAILLAVVGHALMTAAGLDRIADELRKLREEGE